MPAIRALLEKTGVPLARVYEAVQLTGNVRRRRAASAARALAARASPPRASAPAAPRPAPAQVLPRLYLCVTAGSVYIKSMQGRAADVLADLLEMVKGVQQPQRGLFLRHYLAQKFKDKLPDAGSPYDGARSPAAPGARRLLAARPPAAHRRPPPSSSRLLPRRRQAPAARCPTPSTSSSPTLAR